MTNQISRAEEIALIDAAVKAGVVRRFPPGGCLTTAEEACGILRQRGYNVAQRLGSYKVSTVTKGMNAEEIMRFASYVRITDTYASVTAMHQAKKAYHAAQAGLTPRKIA